MASEFSVVNCRALLANTPSILSAIGQGLPAELWRVTEGPGTWTPFEVVCHLLHGEEDEWIPRMRLALSGPPPKTFSPFDREAGHVKYRDDPPDRLLARFAGARRASLAALDSFALDAPALARTAIHPTLGDVTLEQLLACWTTHDLVHIAQIARVLARHEGRFAGPWRQFMSLLRDQPQ